MLSLLARDRYRLVAVETMSVITKLPPLPQKPKQKSSLSLICTTCRTEQDVPILDVHVYSGLYNGTVCSFVCAVCSTRCETTTSTNKRYIACKSYQTAWKAYRKLFVAHEARESSRIAEVCIAFGALLPSLLIDAILLSEIPLGQRALTLAKLSTMSSKMAALVYSKAHFRAPKTAKTDSRRRKNVRKHHAVDNGWYRLLPDGTYEREDDSNLCKRCRCAL